MHWVQQQWLHSYLSPSFVMTVHWVYQRWLHTITCLSTSITSTVRAPSVLTFIHTVKCTPNSPTVATYYYLSNNIHHIHSESTISTHFHSHWNAHRIHQQWLRTITCLSTSITSTVRAPSVLTFIHTVKCTPNSPTVATYYYLSNNIHHIHSESTISTHFHSHWNAHRIHQQWLRTITCLSTSITSTVRAPSVLTFIHTVKCTPNSPTVATYYYLSNNTHSRAASVLTLILTVTLLSQSMPFLRKQTRLISVIFLFFFSPKTKPIEEAESQMIHLKI